MRWNEYENSVKNLIFEANWDSLEKAKYICSTNSIIKIVFKYIPFKI